MSVRRRKRRLAKRAAALGVGILLALVAAEVAVRVLRIPPFPLAPLDRDSYRLSDNPVLSYEYLPGYEPDPVDSNGFHDGINQAGFRDRDYPLAKPPGTKRIVIFGDSTTAGNGVAYRQDTYPKILEVLLNEDDSTELRFEVLNMAVGGYHTLQEVEMLRSRGLDYCPDHVLVTFCLNDFDLHADGGVYERLSREEASGQLGPEPKDVLLKYSRLAFVLHHRLKPRKAVTDGWYLTQALKGRTTVEAGLQLLSTLQREQGFEAHILILPAFPKSMQDYEFLDVHYRVFATADGLPGFSVIDLLEDFRAIDDDGDAFADGGGVHMHERGHRIMAEILLKRLGTSFRERPRRACDERDAAHTSP